MRLPRVVALMTISFAVVPSDFGADSIAWGPVVNGVRLGTAIGSDMSNPTIRITFQNVSGHDQDVLLGYQNGRGPIYNLKFITKGSDGKVSEGLELAAYYPVEGLMLPVSITLSSVRNYDIILPLKNIIYSSRTETLERLLKSGYSVRVSFQVDGQSMGGTLPHHWVGKLESAEVSLPR